MALCLAPKFVIDLRHEVLDAKLRGMCLAVSFRQTSKALSSGTLRIVLAPSMSVTSFCKWLYTKVLWEHHSLGHWMELIGFLALPA